MNASAVTDGLLTTLQVTVTDEAIAKDQLLRLVLSDEQITVISFNRKRYELEDVFMHLVEGGDNGN